MPRPRNSYLFNLFKSKDLNEMVCYNEDCNGKKLCRHSANLERHLQKIHPSIYSIYMTKKKVIKFPWKAHMEKKLINLVRGYPVLWDKSENQNVSEDLVRNAWEEISGEMKTYSPLLRAEICKKKWNAFKKKFIHECKKFPQSTPESDADAKENWKYFPDLLFLRDKIKLPLAAETVDQNVPETITDMEIIITECIKEEDSDETYLLDGETLEETTAQEESQISVNTEQNEPLPGDTTCSDENDLESVEEIIIERNNNEKVTRPQTQPLRPNSDQEDGDDADTINVEPRKQKRKKPRSIPEKETEDSNRESVEDTTIERNNNNKVTRLQIQPLRTNSDEEDDEDDNDDDADSIIEEPEKQKRKKPRSIPEKETVDSNYCEHDPDKMFLLSLLPFLKGVDANRKLLVRHSLQGVLLEEEQQQQRQQKQNQQPHPPASNGPTVFVRRDFVEATNSFINHII